MTKEDVEEMKAWIQTKEDSLEIPIQENALPRTTTTQIIEESPSTDSPHDVQHAQPAITRWRQEGNRLWLDCEFGSFYWDMPPRWELAKTHLDLLKLAEWVLLAPWIPGIIHGHEWTRKPGKRPGLSFSGGVESTAAMLLMPRNTVMAYHERDFESMLKHDNAHRFIKRLRWSRLRRIHVIKSDHEKIRTNWGNMNGFSTDLACAVHLILLADYFDLDSIAVGMPIDNSWLAGGKVFRDFPNCNWFRKWAPPFKAAGLEINLVVNMISQAGCLEVVRKKGLANWAQSCLRAPAGQTCGRCWKCFFKNSLLGHEIDVTSVEIQQFSSTEPLKTAAMVLYATKKTGMFDDLEQLQRFKHIDLDWFDGIYEPGLELVPEKYRQRVAENLRELLGSMPKPYDLEYTDLENPPYTSSASGESETMD